MITVNKMSNSKNEICILKIVFIEIKKKFKEGG